MTGYLVIQYFLKLNPEDVKFVLESE